MNFLKISCSLTRRWHCGVRDLAQVNRMISINWKQPTQQLTPQEIHSYLTKWSVNVPENFPQPLLDFTHWNDDVRKILEKEFKAPTPIQSLGWTSALRGHDMVGVASTGSGKTLAYALPGLAACNEELLYPQVLVLAPTRELVLQITSVFQRYDNRVVSLYGGQSRRSQIYDIRRTRPQVLVCTPGRLYDFISTSEVKLEYIKYLVLDEADRMLDMGFEPQIREIIKYLPEKRQTVMWSATWPKDVQELSSRYMKDPLIVKVGKGELEIPPTIKQFIHVIDSSEKLSNLKKLVDENNNKKILVFTQMKRTCNIIQSFLSMEKVNALVLNGDLSQTQREDTLNEFRDHKSAVLVATDVASRGLDVNDISVVINYDMPSELETYVHRVGRTGRAGKNGDAHSLFTYEDSHLSAELIMLLHSHKQEVPSRLVEFANNPIFKRKDVYGNKKSTAFGPRRSSSIIPKKPNTDRLGQRISSTRSSPGANRWR